MLAPAANRRGLASAILRLASPGNRAFSQRLLMVLIALALVSIFFDARHLGIDRSDPSNRTRFHAIPVAISQIYHGRKHDYTAYRSIAMPFQSTRPLAEVIAATRHMKVPTDDPTYFWTADDRGLSDFVNVAFRLFGPKVSALADFWVVMLGLSAVVAALRFRNDLLALAVIACTLIGVGATLPAWTRATTVVFAESSINLLESRMFDVLGIVAAVHLILATLRPLTIRRWVDVACAGAQAAFIAALVLARGSVSWLVLAVALIAFMVLAFRWWQHAKTPSVAGPIVVLAAVAGSYLTMVGYQRVMFNPAYFGELGPRTFWHNVLIGMGTNADLARQTGVKEVSDRGAIDAVLGYMHQRGDPRLDARWDARDILNSLGGYGTFDWLTYERVAREIVIRSLLAQPAAAIRMVLWERPAAAAVIFSCRILGLSRTCPAKQIWWINPRKLHGDPFSWLWLGLAAAVAASVFSAGAANLPDRGAGHIIVALLFSAVIGLAPSLVVYPAVTQLGGTAVLLFATVAFSVTALALRLRYVARLAPVSSSRIG